MKPVRWGIIGIGKHFISRVLLPLTQSEDVDLSAVASRSENKAKETAEKYGIEKYYGSYDALLADPTIEAVFITLPNHMHLDWIKKAADAGKHILCEKPITLNAEDARAAATYTAEKNVLLMEAFMYRFHPQWIHAKDLIRTESIGTLQTVHTSFSYNNPDPKNIRNIKEYGGGALYDIGCYAVSTARYLFGREPARVISLINRHDEFETDILSSGILDFGDARSTFTVGTMMFPDQSVSAHCTGGRLKIHIPFNTFPDVPANVTVINGVGTRELSFGPADQYGLEFEHFSQTIRNGGKAPTPIDDAISNMAVLDALFRSGETGNWETVQTY